jgi:DNA polymerase
VGIRWQEQGHDLDFPIRTAWFSGGDIAAGLAQFDWSKTAVLCHHAHFDGLILAHHYGVRPALWLDTLSMARALIGNHLSVSLESLAAHFGLEEKRVPYDRMKGKHWHDMDAALQRQLAEGCLHDCELTFLIFQKLLAGEYHARAMTPFPLDELLLIDSTIRCFTEPVLVGDTSALAAIWEQEARARDAILAELQVTKKDLNSADKFAALLRQEGEEPETKPGKPKIDKITGEEHARQIYAFAATDDYMRGLLEHDAPRVRALAEARLAAKSNIVQTRSERLGWMSTRGAMCIYLAYCAALTTRWGGGDATNFQNLTGELGRAMQAPPGHVVVVADASQIECRLLNKLAGQHDKVEEFRQKLDPYVAVASRFCGFPVTKQDHPKLRQAGKVVELQSGFGSGGPKIAATLRKNAVPCTDEEGIGWRDAYRNTHKAVVNLWYEADEVLKKLAAGLSFSWKCVDIRDKRIYLPNGLPLIYDTLELHEGEWRLKTRRGYVKMYGAKLVENLIQALSATHTRGAWLACTQAGMKMVSMMHDSLVAVVPEEQGGEALKYMIAALSKEPDWLPGIPLDAEGFVSRSMSKKDEVKWLGSSERR